MLERVRAGIDVTGEPHPEGEARWRPLRLVEIAPQVGGALSAFRARRSLPAMRLAGRRLLLETAWAPQAPEIAAPWCATMRVDRTVAELVMPHALLDLICRHADASVAATSLRLDHAALVLEFALSEALQEIEAALGCSISLTSVAKGSGQLDSGPDAFALVALQLQGAGNFWCRLRLEPPYLLALSRYLDRISTVSEHHIDLPLPVRLRWAMVELSLTELRGLAPGDIVLADRSCRQPGTAIAVFGEHLIAPVELLRNGYRLSGKPSLAQGSGWEWTLDRGSPDAAGTTDGHVGDVPVRLFFEVGQFELGSGVMTQLNPGTILPLARPLEDGVDLIVDGARIGRGQITTVGDAVGIRVTRL
jgi:type III secretion protein Q